MWQSLFITLVIGLCLFFIGRKLYRQFKIATNPDKQISCGCGCSGCSSPKRLAKKTETPKSCDRDPKSNPRP
jgi:hypothetical protein